MSTCSTATLSGYLDLTPQRLNQLHKEGWLVKADHNKWDTLKSIRGYIRFLRQRVDKYAAGGLSLDDAKLRRWKADAETMELKLKLAKGQVVDIAFATELIINVLDSIQAQLQAMPTRLSPLLLGQSEYRIVEKILTDGINRIQAEIAGTDITDRLRTMGINSQVAESLAELESASSSGYSELGRVEQEVDA
jgi:phage terminase Nu1 subunit (DNA packaging protein)